MAFCKSCGKQIVWVKSEAGKAIPCDAEKVMGERTPLGGDLVVTDNGTVVRCKVGSCTDESKLVVGYISHFATCPHANRHRKRR